MQKIISQLDPAGYFVGAIVADADPLTPDGYLFPAGAVNIAPPDAEEGKRYFYAGGAWEVQDMPTDPVEPEPTLEEARAARSTLITGDCIAAIDSGFDFQAHHYDSDLISRTNIIGTATGVQAGIPLPDGFTWRTSDNENVPIDGPGVIALGAALLQHVNTQYAISWQLKAQIEAATTPEEVAAVSWPPEQTAP